MTANAIDAHELARSLNQLMAGSESQPSIEVYANLLQFLMGVNPDLLLLVDTQGRIHYCNRNVRDALGLDAEDIVGQPLHVLVHQPDHHLAGNLLAAFAQSGITPPSIELRLNCKSEADQVLWVQMSASSMLNENAGQSVHPIICLSAKDISAQKRAEAEIEHQLTHDNLTGLVNRAQFIAEVDKAIARAKENEQSFMLMFFDLDRFKTINDSLGHSVGDLLLRAIAQRLADAQVPGDVLARFGGDEFGLLLPNAVSPESGQQACDKVLSLLAEPFSIESYQLSIDTSIGLARYPDHGTSSVGLVQSADIAMYHVKETGKNNYAVFDSAMNMDRFAQIQLEQELRRALAKSELEVHYQPVVSLRSGEITGVEALARWNHPRLGLMAPSRFLDLAEEAGLVADLDNFVQRCAMQQVSEWQAAGHDIYVSINASAAQLEREEFASTFAATLKASGIAAANVKLELTEKTLIKRKQSIVAKLNYLRDLGVGIAADDFGTGYSSLSYLKDFPLTSLKIDQSFMRDITDEKDTASLVDAIIAMAHGLGFSVVAEGVETAAQIRYLLARQCGEAQGYIFSAPLNAEKMLALLVSNSAKERRRAHVLGGH